MSLNDTVSAERLHISFFGVRNAGKSSLVNAVTGQSLSVVSDVKGTTTDPVRKAMELLPLGPVVITDTPGFDDEGSLGSLRVEKARDVLRRTDIAVLVADCRAGLLPEDRELIELFRERKIPFAVAMNKADLLPAGAAGAGGPAAPGHDGGADSSATPGNDGGAENHAAPEDVPVIYVSALTGQGVDGLKELLGRFAEGAKTEKLLIADLLSPGDMTVLVVPVDESAPKGRLILPQQQTMRELLDFHMTFSVCQPEELKSVMSAMKRRPRLVVTDSQAFERVAADTPEDVMLTSFSILFARYRGELETLAAGAKRLSRLKDEDRVLISEGCTHHRQCNDIGTVKLPKMIEKYTGAKPEYTFTSGGDFPRELSEFSLIVHCGGCMLNRAEMTGRIEKAKEAGVDMVNYGVAIAQMKGILERSLKPFGK